MLRFVSSCVLVCALAFQAKAAKPTFTPLPGAIPTDISSDGKVVVGNTSLDSGSSRRKAFRWTNEFGIAELVPPAGGSNMQAKATSADGSVVVGTFESFSQRTFRWTANGAEEISVGYELRDLSDDAFTVLGNVADIQPFLWTEEVGYQFLRPLELFEPRIAAFAMTGDATTIVGQVKSSQAFLDFEPMRWTAADGFQALGTPEGETRGFSAIDVSADGNTLLIQKGNRSEYRGFLWNATDGYRELDAARNIVSRAMNENATIVVGDTIGALGGLEGAFVWDAQHGVRNLQDVLVTEYGLASQLDGWRLSSATEISADGRTIIGSGHAPSGQQAGWIVTVPEPTGIVLAASGFLALLLWCGKRA